jgi:hypothetical protein
VLRLADLDKARFRVLTAVLVKIYVLRDVTPYRLVSRYLPVDAA